MFRASFLQDVKDTGIYILTIYILSLYINELHDRLT